MGCNAVCVGFTRTGDFVGREMKLRFPCSQLTRSNNQNEIIILRTNSRKFFERVLERYRPKKFPISNKVPIYFGDHNYQKLYANQYQYEPQCKWLRCKIISCDFFCSTGYQNYKSVCLSDAYIIDKRNNYHPITNLVHDSFVQLTRNKSNKYHSIFLGVICHANAGFLS